MWITSWPILVIGQSPAVDQVADSVSQAVQVQSVWDFVVKGGPMMAPIILCSLIALTVVIERLIVLMRSNVLPSEFLPNLKDTLKDGAGDRTKALEYCESNSSNVARIFSVAIKRLGEPLEHFERHIQEAGERQVIKLRKKLRILSVIAAVAPLMGLLGTIFGMIAAFQTVASSGEALGKTELLAEGIYEAMITTAAGLLLAIPVLIAYHGLSAKIEGLVGEMDHVTVEFMEEFAGDYSGVLSTTAVATPGGNGKDLAKVSPVPALSATAEAGA